MNRHHIEASYDRPVDVLHLVMGNPQAYEGDGLPFGVEIDYSIKTGAPCGAKVIGFERNGWRNKIPELANLIASHLSVEDKDVLHAVKKIVGQ